MDSTLYTYLIIPLLIFCARIMDVSIGTIRLIFISRGFKLYAPILGFVEVLVWLLAIQQIFNNLSNMWCYLAYAGGFATGTYVGMVLEERLSVGKVLLQVITKRDAKPLLKKLKDNRFIFTSHGAQGPKGNVRTILLVIERTDLEEVITIIKKFHPNSFYSVQDVRFSAHKGNHQKINLKRLLRKAK